MEEKKMSKWVLKCKDCSHIFYSGKYKPIKTEKKRRVLFSKRDFLRMIPGLGKLIKPKIIIEHNWKRENYFETEMFTLLILQLLIILHLMKGQKIPLLYLIKKNAQYVILSKRKLLKKNNHIKI